MKQMRDFHGDGRQRIKVRRNQAALETKFSRRNE